MKIYLDPENVIEKPKRIDFDFCDNKDKSKKEISMTDETEQEFVEIIDNKEVTIICEEEELDLAIIAITPFIEKGFVEGFSPRWYLKK